jgi:tetratricopeptide (TPR) repeat protein
MRGPALLLAALLALPPFAARSQELQCIPRCRALAQRGELMEGLSEEGCQLRLCHEEARELYVEAEYERASAALERIGSKLADSPAFQLDRGLVEYARGNFASALDAFDRVIAREPTSLRGGSQRAHVLIRLERFDEARAQFEKLLGLPAAKTELQGLGTESYLRGNLGALRLIQDDVAGARADLEKALRLDAGNTLAATYLYRVLPEVEARRLDGRGVWLMMNASEDAALYMLGRSSQQLADLLARAPHFAEAYFLQADILRAQGMHQACESLLERGEQQLPKDASIRAERLRCQLLRVGPDSEAARPAIAEIMALARAHPDNERIRNIVLALQGR